MAIKVKFNKRWYDVKKRIKKIPQIAIPIMMAFVKTDALDMVKNFHDGIKKKSFGLEKLKADTIKRKRHLGMERPSTPLYALGDESKKKSYVNMLRIKRIKNGYKVYPTKAKHHSGNIRLNRLLEVHENGTIIKRGDILIRIPPRPAFLMAYKQTLKDRQKRLMVKSREISHALRGYINKATIDSINKIKDKMLTSGLKKYEIND